ncbi:MAG: hypothetical protein M1830_007456 [Pleopsidium flavum]|nr:MAG: hypothetical protein M1830_007456 [Pleopsidium flavum]
MPDEPSSPLSSPDPLGNSPSPSMNTQYLSPSKPTRRTPTKSGTQNPFVGTTSSKTNIKLQDFILNTPPAGIIARSNSPTKSTAKTENLLSPWRIRVTVEAERDDDDKIKGRKKAEKIENSPTKRLSERTTTTIVPLKGLQESSPTATRAWRARKAEVGSSPVMESGLVVGRKRGRRQTWGNDGDRDGSVGATPLKRGRGRPRKSLPVGDDGDVMIAGTTVGTDHGVPRTGATMAGKKTRGRRKAMSPVMIVVDENLDEDVHQCESQSQAGDQGPTLSGTSLNRPSSSPPQKVTSRADLNSPSILEIRQACSVPNAPSERDVGSADREMWRSTITNHEEQPVEYSGDASDRPECEGVAMTGDPTNDHREFDSILESEGFSLISLDCIASARQNVGNPTAQHSRQTIESGIDNVVKNLNLRSSNLTDGVPMAKPSPMVESVSQSKGSSERQSIGLSSKAPMSSELSLQVEESAADVQNMSSLRPPETCRGNGLSSIVTEVGLNPDCSKISDLPSSPPVHLFQDDQTKQHQTPSLDLSSPRLPPPIQQGDLHRSSPSSVKPKGDTPKLVRVVGAGIALQGVLDTNARSPSLRNPLHILAKQGSSDNAVDKSPKERLDDLFEGFGAGTRRELRAGLRLGEELARRQKLAAQAQQVNGPCVNRKSEDDVFVDVSKSEYPKLPTPEDKEEYTLVLPASEQTVEYPSLQKGQLLSPERSEQDEDAMSWKADTPVKVYEPETPVARLDRDIFNEPVASTLRRREVQWQREREAISRQIEMANESQVIVISDDDSNVQHELGNLQDDETGPLEADIWQVEAQSADQTAKSPPIKDEILQEEVVKPRRSKIPSPWRRDSQIVYSDESTEDQSGLFWQPDQRAKQMAREREERKRRKESHLDVSAMLGLKDNVIKETRAIDTYSNHTDVKEPLGNQVEMTTNEEQMVEVDSIDEESYSSEEQLEETSDMISEDDASTEDGESIHEVANPDLKAPVSSAPAKNATVLKSQPPSWLERLAETVSGWLPEDARAEPTEEWTNGHYQYLDNLYQRSKTSPEDFPCRTTWGFRLLRGFNARACGYTMKITTTHLGIVDAFQDRVKEHSLQNGGDGKEVWDEEYVVKRLFSLVAGEEMRREEEEEDYARRGLGEVRDGGG